MNLSFSEFCIDSEALELCVADKCVALDQRHISLLSLLAEHYPEHCSKQDCLAEVWQDTVVSDMSLSKLVSDTRKLFAKAGYQGPLIQTVHGRGYRLEHVLGKQLQAAEQARLQQATPLAQNQTHQPIESVAPLKQSNSDKAPQTVQISQSSWWEIFAKVLIALVLVLGLMFQLWQGGSLNVVHDHRLTYSEPSDAIGRILWIDDHPENNLVEKAYFEQKKIGVYNTVTSEEALMLLTMYQYQVVISDMGRHGDPLAGLKLLQSIRENGHKTPFYLYTYVESEGVISAIDEAGGQAVVIDSDSLYRFVLSHFSTKQT